MSKEWNETPRNPDGTFTRVARIRLDDSIEKMAAVHKVRPSWSPRVPVPPKPRLRLTERGFLAILTGVALPGYIGIAGIINGWWL